MTTSRTYTQEVHILYREHDVVVLKNANMTTQAKHLMLRTVVGSVGPLGFSYEEVV